MKNFLVIVFCFLILFTYGNNKIGHADQQSPSAIHLYVNPFTGSNANNGTAENPLKSLNEAATRVNEMTGKGSITIYLSKGIHGLNETVDFNPVHWQFTKDARLTIRAEVLPNDKGWNPSEMPVMVSTMAFVDELNDKNEVTGGQNFGILIQNSHVTVQGLRILGEPVHETPFEGLLIRNYPIVWEGKDLEDLRVTQCLFIGDIYALPNHLGILASGKELEVDHCVFYGVKDSVVMWHSTSSNSKIHHNYIINTYGAAIWTWAATEDFKFYNNVISNANVVWILDKEAKNSFEIENSMIVGYKSLVNKGGGAHGFGENADPNKLIIGNDVVLEKEGSIEFVSDQTRKFYLHIAPGSKGSEYGAGLFYKN